MKFFSATSVLFALVAVAAAAPAVDVISSPASIPAISASAKASSAPATSVTSTPATKATTTSATKATTAPATGTAVSVSVSYDDIYDNSKGSLSTVACSDGANGMLTKGFKTFGSLPGAPLIGGAGVIPGWNSNMCGTCWQLTYGSTSINVLAIDSAGPGTFNIAYAAMNKLTNGQAKQLGRVGATAQQVAAAACGAH